MPTLQAADPPVYETIRITNDKITIGTMDVPGKLRGKVTLEKLFFGPGIGFASFAISWASLVLPITALNMLLFSNYDRSLSGIISVIGTLVGMAIMLLVKPAYVWAVVLRRGAFSGGQLVAAASEEGPLQPIAEAVRAASTGSLPEAVELPYPSVLVTPTQVDFGEHRVAARAIEAVRVQGAITDARRRPFATIILSCVLLVAGPWLNWAATAPYATTPAALRVLFLLVFLVVAFGSYATSYSLSASLVKLKGTFGEIVIHATPLKWVADRIVATVREEIIQPAKRERKERQRGAVVR